MPSTVTLTEIVTINGRVFLRFKDGWEREFDSMADLVAWARSADTDPELARKITVAYAEARSTNLANIASVRDKDCTLDVSQPSIFKVQ